MAVSFQCMTKSTTIKKKNIHSPYNSAVTLLYGHLYWNNEKLMFTQNLYLNIHGSYICDGQKLEYSQMLFIVWIDKYAGVHPFCTILFIDLSQLAIRLSLNKPF